MSYSITTMFRGDSQVSGIGSNSYIPIHTSYHVMAPPPMYTNNNIHQRNIFHLENHINRFHSYPRELVLVPTESSITNTIDRNLSLILSTRGGSTTNTLESTITLTNISKWITSSKQKCWSILLFAIILETIATLMTKQARDTQNTPQQIFAMGLYIISLTGFSLSLAQIDVSIAYTVWCALGSFVVSVMGIVHFGETCNFVKVLSLTAMILGVVGLNLAEMGEEGGGHH